MGVEATKRPPEVCDVATEGTEVAGGLGYVYPELEGVEREARCAQSGGT